jgi:hypothetical protein
MYQRITVGTLIDQCSGWSVAKYITSYPVSYREQFFVDAGGGSVEHTLSGGTVRMSMIGAESYRSGSVGEEDRVMYFYNPSGASPSKIKLMTGDRLVLSHTTTDGKVSGVSVEIVEAGE